MPFESRCSQSRSYAGDVRLIGPKYFLPAEFLPIYLKAIHPARQFSSRCERLLYGLFRRTAKCPYQGKYYQHHESAREWSGAFTFSLIPGAIAMERFGDFVKEPMRINRRPRNGAPMHGGDHKSSELSIYMGVRQS
jgi:hypothetical protein